MLGPGQQNDMAPACDLIRGIPTEKVLADRAYDADSLHDLIYEQGGEPVIPPRRHRKYQHPYDRIAYNFAKQLKALKFRTPYEAIDEIWKSKPDVFIVKPTHHMLGPNT